MAMKVKLKVDRWLRQSLNSELASSKEIFISAPEGASIWEIGNNLAEEDPVLWKSLFDEKTHMIQPDVIVTLNNRIVNPYDRSEATFKEGDELTFLAMVDGG
jgi:molybdopterin converting factor small subunit